MHTIGSRLKAWRSALNLKQEEAAARVGLPKSTYQNYERDERSPAADSLEVLVRAGINANWLLTGEGPMMLADLQQRPPAMASQINEPALAALLEGAIGLVREGMTAERACRLAVRTYAQALAEGEITPTGIGHGTAGKAA
ncbi:MAG: helix-turn-helix domain-containing protein [Pseudomonadota bacterium]